MKNTSNYAIYSTILGIILLSAISANESVQVFAQTSTDDRFTIKSAEQIKGSNGKIIT